MARPTRYAVLHPTPGPSVPLVSFDEGKRGKRGRTDATSKGASASRHCVRPPSLLGPASCRRAPLPDGRALPLLPARCVILRAGSAPPAPRQRGRLLSALRLLGALLHAPTTCTVRDLASGLRPSRSPPKGAAAPLEPPKPTPASVRMPSLHAPRRRERE